MSAEAVMRLALRDLRSFEYRRGDLIHQRDLGAKCMCAKCIESRADAALSAVAPPPVLEGMVDREQVLQDYVADYEYLGETEDGCDACYQPNERERLLIEDAIRGWDSLELPAASPAAPAQPEGGEAVAGKIPAVDGQFPAPITNHKDWPERYADGFNDALQLVIDCGFARPAPAQQAVTDTALGAWCRAEMQRVGTIKTVSGSDVYGIMFPAVARGAGVDAAVIAALASNAAASAAHAQEQPRCGA